MSLVRKPPALDHLNQADLKHDPQTFKYPPGDLKVKAHRPKTYRLFLHSDDRVAGTPMHATFNLGDLRGAWGLNDNLDAGSKHYECKLENFYLESTIAATIEVRSAGFPHQSESWDSLTGGPTNLLRMAPLPLLQGPTTHPSS
jgi:hypothetical protein